MCRTLPLVTLLALATTAPCAHAEATPRPPLEATLEVCTTSSLPVERLAVFVASMPAIARANRMRIRFDLERRRPAERLWRRIKAPGFGVWERSDPNVAGFVFRKRVTGLPTPASYRALVRFRWIAKGGAMVRRARARTQACEQPDLRANVVPGALAAVLGIQPGPALYTLTVRNTGGTTATAFSVRVGASSTEVAPLLPGEERSLSLLAPACSPPDTVLVRVDADGRVEESDERDNTVRRPCPLGLGRASSVRTALGRLHAP
jgi:hypothetical protein